MANRIVVIGGGAAGFYGAITAATFSNNAEVIILEKSDKLLSKVKVSGGGRCNVTHACFENSRLIKSYPRGSNFLKKAFQQFSTSDTIEWFEKRGVQIKAEEDGRMFPVTNDSQSIIDCFLQEAERLKIKIYKKQSVKRIKLDEEGFKIETEENTYKADKLLIATGGHPKKEGYNWLQEIGFNIEEPVPSLFTFNTPDSPLKGLAGVSMPDAEVRVIGSKLQYRGPLLITHWGFSGPAVLKLSAWGARLLHDLGYNFKIQIKWIADQQEDPLREELYKIREVHNKKVIASNPLWNIPQRLWKELLSLAEIDHSLRWADLPKKQFNKMIEALIRAEFEVKGKTTFKEEFVTCGGIDLSEIHPETMESKKLNGLYFAGEVINVDGITGGFNFQNAWTTGYIAGKSMVK
jgi:predicted Rossmann fold flavoprotein